MRLERRCVPTGKNVVDKIVENGLYVVGTEHFRAVKGLYTWTAAPLAADLMRVDRNGQRPFVSALQYNPFNKGWDLKATDFGTPDGNIETHRVNDLLGIK